MTKAVEQIHARLESLSDPELAEVRELLDIMVFEPYSPEEEKEIESALRLELVEDPSDDLDASTPGFWAEFFKEGEQRGLIRRRNA